jgi:hypothetical protein
MSKATGGTPVQLEEVTGGTPAATKGKEGREKHAFLRNEPTGGVFLGGERQKVGTFSSKSGFVLRIDDNRKGGSRL